MVIQGCKSTLQKTMATPLETGLRKYGVWIAIECSYKLGQKHEFKFLCKLGWFLQRQSHNYNVFYTDHGVTWKKAGTLLYSVPYGGQKLSGDFILDEPQVYIAVSGAYELLKENETYMLPIPGATTIQITLAIALHNIVNLVILKLYIWSAHDDTRTLPENYQNIRSSCTTN